jgi:putative tricarboxylic transport membrane protein
MSNNRIKSIRRNKMKTRIFKVLATTALLGFGSAATAAECIAPANPGGGWDFACRTISKIMFDIGAVDKPIQITNMAGGGGGLAFNHVVSERNDDADLIVAASSATTTRLAQNAYAGMTADQVRFVGAIGIDPGVIVVAADSPFMTLSDLLEAVVADPSSVTFAGGSAVGGFDHMKPLMLLKEAGLTDITTVKYIGLDGGGDAITQTIGGFTQAMTGDMSEVVGFLASGDIRVLAVLTSERVAGAQFEGIPTAMEQGYDVVAGNWRGLYIPRGVSDETFQLWAGRLQAVADSDEWAEAMTARGLAPFTLVGDEFQGYIDNLVVEIRQMSKDIGVIQ